MKNWHGLMKLLDIQHIRNGKVIWQQTNILNTFHSGGELFVLSCAFDNDGSLPPNYYYLGLDNRTEIQVDDILSDITGEPGGNGYLRAAVASNAAFSINLQSGIYTAYSPIVTFSATGSGYGPVSNLFLATTIDNSGILLASAQLSEPATFEASDSLNMRMRLALQDGDS